MVLRTLAVPWGVFDFSWRKYPPDRGGTRSARPGRNPRNNDPRNNEVRAEKLLAPFLATMPPPHRSRPRFPPSRFHAARRPVIKAAAGAPGSAEGNERHPPDDSCVVWAPACYSRPSENAASRSWLEYARNAICVWVPVIPGTLDSLLAMTSARSSWWRTRAMAIRSQSPATE